MAVCSQASYLNSLSYGNLISKMGAYVPSLRVLGGKMGHNIHKACSVVVLRVYYLFQQMVHSRLFILRLFIC